MIWNSYAPFRFSFPLYAPLYCSLASKGYKKDVAPRFYRGGAVSTAEKTASDFVDMKKILFPFWNELNSRTTEYPQSSAWTRSEAPHQDVNVTVNQFLRMFKQADPTCLMEQDEYIQFNTLHDTVTVYRGVTPHNAKSVKALSWSLDQETAEWFAPRFDENGTVYEAQIDKKHIYAYFCGRNESEGIVDPSYLTNITEVQDLSSDFLLSQEVV